MTVDELMAEVERRKALGHEYLQIVIPREVRPKNWDRVFILHGLYGRIVGELPRDEERRKRRFLVDLRTNEVEARLKRYRSNGYDIKHSTLPDVGVSESEK